MKSFENDPSPRNGETPQSSRLSRRGFLGGLGAAAAAVTSGIGVAGLEPRAEAAPVSEAPASPGALRRNQAWKVRMNAAEHWRKQPLTQHLNNGDEARYPNRIGNYSKGLPHNRWGEVEPRAYQSLLDAVASGNPEDYDAITLGGTAKLTSPQSGLAFDLEGADSCAIAVPPPPALASAEQAAEGVELYWAALLRDVNFLDYAGHPDVAAAAADLNRFGADFKGARIRGQVTPRTLFRDPLPGTLNGPYLSQFMWMNTPFGVEYVERKMRTALPGTDHLTGYDAWLAAQNGRFVESAAGEVDPVRRYIRNARDLAAWVHMDVLFQAYFNACLILMAPPSDDPTFSGIGWAGPSGSGRR